MVFGKYLMTPMIPYPHAMSGERESERERERETERETEREREREREKEREIILARWRKRGEGGDERLVFTNGESSHEHRRRHACVF